MENNYFHFLGLKIIIIIIIIAPSKLTKIHFKLLTFFRLIEYFKFKNFIQTKPFVSLYQKPLLLV